MTQFGGPEISLLGSVGIFVGVLLLYEGLWQLLSRSETRREARNRRLRLIAKGASTEEVLQLLRPSVPAWRLHGLPFIGTLPRDLRQAGVMTSPATLVLLCAAGAIATGAAASLRLPLPTAAVLSLALWLVVPIALLRSVRAKRTNAFTRQLPDALDLMSRSLRVGHPLNVTMATVADEMADPIATEFGVMVDQVAYGENLVDAVMDLAERMPTEDMRYLATSIAIQHGTGGDLARMLATLSRVIRDRINLRRKIKAISAEGRLSAMILSAIPVLIFSMMSVLLPDYYGSIAQDPAFRPGAAIVIGLVVANALLLRHLVNFKV